MFGRKTQTYTQLTISLLLCIHSGSGSFANTTLKLFGDQIQAIQKFVKTIVEDEFCSKKTGQISTPVGFHAYMGSTKTITNGGVWVYDKVVTNTHNAYNATTGKFTTPEQGLYMFFIDSASNPGHYNHAGLYVNGEIKTWQTCNNFGGKNQWLTCSNSAILLLKKGDFVYVADHLTTASVKDRYSKFSGAKLN